ncbi:hypothetical protein [Amycolatopsis coloradensis]|uniref:hypothetical protein n=1 Tax=Amycolatopsis coloradensis TaxID=76021 RepID=UPI001177A251|nr:hypothetical protein [Amycolatopsis coloradensis]
MKESVSDVVPNNINGQGKSLGESAGARAGGFMLGASLKTKLTIVSVIVVLAFVVLGFVLPSIRAGRFSVNGTAVTSVLLAAVVLSTIFGLKKRKRQ